MSPRRESDFASDLPLLDHSFDSSDPIEHGDSRSEPEDSDDASIPEVSQADWATPVDLTLFENAAANAYALDFIHEATVGTIRRNACKRMWDLNRRHNHALAPHLLSYDTMERRLMLVLPQPKVQWKVQSLETKKYICGSGTKFPEKAYGDRDKYEAVLVWTRLPLRDVIRLHAGTHVDNCDFVVDGKIAYDRVHLTVTCDGIPNGRGSSQDNLHLTSIRFRGCKLVYVLQVRVAKRREAKCADDFFASFVTECNELGVKVDYFVADAPMRAFVKRLKGHAGRYSCETCEARGVCVNKKIVYPSSMKMQRHRTHNRWLEAVADVEQQKACGSNDSVNVKGVMGKSPLLDLHDFDIVNKAPTDPLHREWLGIVKGTLWKLTMGYGKSGNLSAKGQRICSAVSDYYRRLRLPEEFSHRARPIDYANFKAHEWKSLVMTSFNEICNVVRQEIGHRVAHIWISFVFLVLVYYGPEWLYHEFEQDFLHDIHEKMYDNFETEFGQGACSYNWHSFYHMPIARRLGRMCHVSTEPFESAYGLAQGSYQCGTRNIGKQIIKNMLVRCSGHTPQYCLYKLHLEPDRKSLRADNSIAIDNMLQYYKVVSVVDDDVKVKRMITTEWQSPHDPSLPLSTLGVVQFTGELEQEELQYPKEYFRGKGVLLPDNLLVPFFWDLLYS